MTTPTKAPDPETLEKPRRRYHKAAFKLEILKLADSATPSERSALLRLPRLGHLVDPHHLS